MAIESPTANIMRALPPIGPVRFACRIRISTSSPARIGRRDGCSSVIQLQSGIEGFGMRVYTAMTVNASRHSGT